MKVSFNMLKGHKFPILVLFSLIALKSTAQNLQTPGHKLGDPAPLVSIKTWIKGRSISKFETGKIYVVEFWATWCKPCIAAMPHLSTLAQNYKGMVNFLAIDVYESKMKTPNQIKAFVTGMGRKMDFTVGAGDTCFVNSWLKEWDEEASGIPRTYIVNGNGLVAWIGHPKNLAEVLKKVVNNTWNLEEARSKREFDKYLADMDHEAAYTLRNYDGDFNSPGDLGKPDSALYVISEMINKEPKIKFAPITALFTFSALLKTNPHRAYEYGKELIVTSTYEEPAYDAIISNVAQYAGKLTLPDEIYRLGAEAYQAKIDQTTYPELADLPKQYIKMAALYALAHDYRKAYEAKEKSVKIKEQQLNSPK